MKQKLFLILILLISFCFFSCERDDVSIDSTCIEEYVDDPDGVVFKITNDIDSVYYQMIEYTNNGNMTYYYTFKMKVDSVALMKFHCDYLTLTVDENYTWFTKKGQYVCWRYMYVDGNNEWKFLYLGIPNRYFNLRSDKYLIYGESILTDPVSVNNPLFKTIFPDPVNDTVYVKLSSLNSHFW